MVRRGLATVTALLLTAGSLVGGTVRAEADPGPRASTTCATPSGREFERARPESTGLDSALLADALAFAATRNRLNVQVFRHNCLIGEGPTNAQTGNTPWNVWSITKSVVALLAGIAWDRGRLDIGAPIDRYLPPGLGSAKHRSLTVEHLLTESSGLRIGVITEGFSGVIPIDPNSAVQALGVPFDYEPGTRFVYSQRNVDLLAYVIERAVGEPLQRFAQREFFDPLGIPPTDYYWARDRSGNTYGYAHLMIPPNDLARIGMLVAAGGDWGGRRIVSEAYLRQAITPSATSSCYGYLFWLGPGCAENPEFLPDDVYSMSGLGLQHVYIVPSLDLMVVWTGVFGTHTDRGVTGILQYGMEVPHEFFRRLLRAFWDSPIPDPGRYVEPPLRLDPRRYFDGDIALAILGLGPAAYPGCNVLSCLDIPLAPPFADAPPGCLIVACLGPDPRTPGIRAGN
ncbi:serine hydrolase domain-containing protein [Nocardia otitidiscaviarum]|uniref:serine hydrolase domain-containing protein n=1 Tax=Nocardia otitidiscaviarum TaxID=1823 RepID=UPI00189422F1|nr:serine hydrolase [Nocardia otitidiscaviarum]MBF6179015.1 serine hydrolase [Nocardia otitidiscaviarum]